MGGTGEVDEGEVAGMEAGLAAVLLDDDLALGDHVDLAEVGVQQPDVPPPPVGAARPGRRQLTDPDSAQVGGPYLVGHLVPVGRSHVQGSQRGPDDLVDVLGTSADGNIVCPQHHAHRLLPTTSHGTGTAVLQDVEHDGPGAADLVGRASEPHPGGW